MAKRATRKTKTKTASPTAKTKSAPAKSEAKTHAKATTRTRTPSPARGNVPQAGGKSQTKPVVTLSHDEIANRAYMIWLAKGKPAGRDAENWQEAQRELAGDR